MGPPDPPRVPPDPPGFGPPRPSPAFLRFKKNSPVQNNSFCTQNHARGWSGDRVMTIFGKFFMSQNGFLLITNLFKTIQTSSPVATPTKSGMPRRSKGSKHDFKIFIFRGPIFFRSRFFVGHIFEPCFEGFKL